MRRVGVSGPQGGGAYLSRMQQTRLLDAALGIVAEEGFKRLSATRVSARAGMSSKTFYDLFADREDCFLVVFDRAVDQLAAAAAPVWAAEVEWHERVRAALTVLLAALEYEPALGKLVFLEALGAGPRVLVRRGEVLDRVAEFLDEGRVGSPLAEVLPSLTAAGVTGAAFGVIHSRLARDSQEPLGSQEPGSSLLELVNPVMATVVLPYRGREVSARELERPVPELPELPEPVVSTEDAGEDRSADAPPLDAIQLRPTRRTFMVLASVAERAGGSNRVVGEGAGISDPAQVSKMLSRLREHGLVENRGGRTAGRAKAWWLTARGEEFLRAGVDGAPGLGRVRPLRRGRGGRELKRGSVVVRRTRGDTGEGRRVRVLRAAVVEAGEHGYASLTVGHIAARARVSRRTFYEMFDDREACLFAVLQDIDAQITAELRAAALDGLVWRERVRQGLWTVLRFFDREPVLARFCVVESARGDGQIAEYREGLLGRFANAIAAGSADAIAVGAEGAIAVGAEGAIAVGAEGAIAVGAEGAIAVGAEGAIAVGAEGAIAVGAEGAIAVGAEGAIAAGAEGAIAAGAEGAIAAGAGPERFKSAPGECSPLVAEGLAGAVVSILSTRLARTGWRAVGSPGKDAAAGGLLGDLLGELMGLIVLPYLGPVIAREERDRPAPVDPVPARLPVAAAGSKEGDKYLARDPEQPRVSSLRITYRTALVLEAIAREPGVSNLEVARRAQINDQGQVSKLLSRLERHGLAQNTGRGQARGAPNEWRLTPAGQELEQSTQGRAHENPKQKQAA